MNGISEYIAQLFMDNGIIIAVAAYVVGAIIRQSFPRVPKRFIPLIAGLLGIALGVLIPHLFPRDDLFTAAVKGLALGWTATGGFECGKNLFSGKRGAV